MAASDYQEREAKVHFLKQFRPCLIAGITIVVSVFVWRVANAANIVVDSALDNGSGCTLRDAILAANNPTMDLQNGCVAADQPGNSISFDLAFPATINLESSLPTITSDLVMNGQPGPGAMVTIDGGNMHQVLSFEGSTAELNHIALTRGLTDGNGAGLHISAGSIVQLNSVKITDSLALAGGAIYVEGSSTLSIHAGVISNNTATATADLSGDGTAVDGGGGIAAFGSDVQIFNTTLENNTATSGNGGALFITGELFVEVDSNGSRLLMDGSTVSNNRAMLTGGGISSHNTQSTFINSTISSNSAKTGGGLFADVGAVKLQHVTVAENTAEFYGGISYSFPFFAPCCAMSLTVFNSIVAGNSAESLDGQEVEWLGFKDQPVQATFLGNVIGTSAMIGSEGLSQNFPPSQNSYNRYGFSDQRNLPLRRIIEPLSDNGGPTKTHLPSEGSLALNGSRTTGTGDECLEVDQRDSARSVPCDLGSINLSDKERLEFTTFYPVKSRDGKTIFVEL